MWKEQDDELNNSLFHELYCTSPTGSGDTQNLRNHKTKTKTKTVRNILKRRTMTWTAKQYTAVGNDSSRHFFISAVVTVPTLLCAKL
jgi:hypothetical protein